MNQRLPALTARDVIRALERAGFAVSRTSGSHRRLVHSSDPARKGAHWRPSSRNPARHHQPSGPDRGGVRCLPLSRAGLSTRLFLVRATSLPAGCVEALTQASSGRQRWRHLPPRAAPMAVTMNSAANPSAPAVVFLHGIGGSARIWAPQLASFAAAGLRPVALDLLGYGAREPVDRMDFDMLAVDIESQIARLGLDRPVIVGHSMGGMLAQTLLRRGPRVWRAAVLSCTSPAFGDPSGEFQKNFVADRLGPLDAGRTLADLAPGMVAA